VHEFDPRMRCYLWNDIFDAHSDDGKRLVVHADEKLTAFVELEWAIRVGHERPVDIPPFAEES
jgi:hypothetical protein